MLYSQQCAQAGILRLKDVFENGELISLEVFKNKIKHQSAIITYWLLRNAIPQNWLHKLKAEQNDQNTPTNNDIYMLEPESISRII